MDEPVNENRDRRSAQQQAEPKVVMSPEADLNAAEEEDEEDGIIEVGSSYDTVSCLQFLFQS